MDNVIRLPVAARRVTHDATETDIAYRIRHGLMTPAEIAERFESFPFACWYQMRGLEIHKAGVVSKPDVSPAS